MAKAAVVGTGGAAALMVLGFGVFHGTILTEIAIAPVRLFAPILGISDFLVRYLVPEGGSAAGVLLILVAAFGAWALVGFGVSIVLQRAVGRRSANAA